MAMNKINIKCSAGTEWNIYIKPTRFDITISKTIQQNCKFTTDA